MRYIVAIVVAGLVIAGGAWFVRQTELSLKQRLQAAIKEEQAAGRLPADLDVEQVESADIGVDLPSSEILRLTIANALVAGRFVLPAVVLLGSLGIAHLLGRLRR
jgi:hypothetical protein